jgi:hypothetical protein
MAFDQLSVVLAGLAVLIAVGYTAQLSVKSDVAVELPWVGLKKGVFASLRTRIGSLGNELLATMDAGYRKVFLVPSSIAELEADSS